MTTITSSSLLDKLGIADLNDGACFGRDGWIKESGAAPLVSVNPSTGQPIAAVSTASAASCDRVIEKSAEAFAAWRSVRARAATSCAIQERFARFASRWAICQSQMGKIRVEDMAKCRR
jgi:acyl-CoA reductase-like NAD-dependent aldehyde dehydrogenase